MFGKNEIHGYKTFKGKEDLLVTSIFYTLQGEGPFAGQPAIFLRLAHCNLACSFCDTNFSHGNWMSYAVILDHMFDSINNHHQKSGHPVFANECLLVVTGGEPSLQRDALPEFLMRANAHFKRIQIESNGLLSIPYLTNSMCLVVSPKCLEGPNAHYLKPNKEVLKRANCLKFIVTADTTSPYHKIPEWAFKWSNHRKHIKLPIYVSPMAEYKRLPDLTKLSTGELKQRSEAERISFWENDLLDMAKVRANHEYAAQYALDHGLFLTMQMQLFSSLP